MTGQLTSDEVERFVYEQEKQILEERLYHFSSQVYYLGKTKEKEGTLSPQKEKDLTQAIKQCKSVQKEIDDFEVKETKKQKRKLAKEKNINKLIANALSIQKTGVIEANTLGFMARSMILTTMPHRKPKSNEFRRVNGNHSLYMMAPSDIGLPYGVIPRLIIAYFTTQAIRTKKREISLGHSLSEFMSELDMLPTGGRWGSITRLKNQLTKLTHTFITSSSIYSNNSKTQNMLIVDDADIWWNPQNPEQNSMFPSKIKLGERFFNEIVKYSVPLDMRILKALKKSPLALDIYMFYTYRLAYLRKDTVIPYQVLFDMFGSDYAELKKFKYKFKKATEKVCLFAPEFNVQDHKSGLLMSPSKLHIPKKN